MNFQELQLMPALLRALDAAGYKTPTPIQAQSIPYILEGRDILGCAQTGTGKTAAFALPLLQRLVEAGAGTGRRTLRALIVAPTRELAVQIGESFAAYGKNLGLRHTVLFGGVKQGPQTKALEPGVDILVATPGRLLDLIGQGFVRLDAVELFVLDEADRMLDMGFLRDVQKLLKLLPKRRQSLFFSATMAPEIQNLANSILTNPHHVSVTPVATTAETIRQHLLYVEKADKLKALLHLIDTEQMDQVLVFTRTKHGADKVVKLLHREGVEAMAIHGNKSQNARQSALKLFSNRKLQVLVATDIAARGIDIDELRFVVNYEIPNEAETYVHRIGRSGRAGAKGVAFSLCEVEERAYIREIQKLIRMEIPVLEEHPFVSTIPLDGSRQPKALQGTRSSGGSARPARGPRDQSDRHDTRSPRSEARPQRAAAPVRAERSAPTPAAPAVPSENTSRSWGRRPGPRTGR